MEARSYGERYYDYVIDELKYISIVIGDGIEPSFTNAIWHSDNTIPKSLKDHLLECVSKLEDVPEPEKDWHPGSNNQVRNLVHPSLHCLVYGKSKRTTRHISSPVDYICHGKDVPLLNGFLQNLWMKDIVLRNISGFLLNLESM